MDVQVSGSGGLAAVSAGVSEWLVLLILIGLVVVGIGILKLWAMFHG